MNEGSSRLQTFMKGEIDKDEILIEVRKGERHAEQVLLDYAREHNFTIEALGVSRPRDTQRGDVARIGRGEMV